MIASGATVVDAQAVLGHASSHTTLNIYAHLFQDRLDDITGRLDHLISGGCGQNPATGQSE